MILLDTSVMVNIWRKPTHQAHQALRTHVPHVAGVTRAELMHGAKDSGDLAWMERALADFQNVSAQDETWVQHGRNLYNLRRAGVTVPFQDVLLATLAIENGLEVWTYDAHFQMMQRVLTDLKLFQPEPE
jgi:predicted nucleic acid-binding protein